MSSIKALLVKLLETTDGWKTLLACLALFALGGYQIYKGNEETGTATIFTALALLGVRRAVAKWSK